MSTAAAFRPRAAPRVARVAHARQLRAAPRAEAEVSRPALTLREKCQAAMDVFFPPSINSGSAREVAKSRLRMVLVADRCIMSQDGIAGMKGDIMSVVSEYVELADANDVEVTMEEDDVLGTVYSVSLPVKRVAPTVAQMGEGDGERELYESLGIKLSWDGDYNE
eukprot:CAMPEP_0119161800 /NCGR_PEP_ID=MMETSP1315-20130426/1709_1 /TAXON_ID=676789 /ORGANISM="Prasinoderma singularis, Strain RCC927" /LENGTH=164 /DNA_ID=CAMNT_0007154589 /DNA_START=12 /DNA_END=506 /DNA_ORIENTATION=+